MLILGISCFYHDAAACIVKNGKILVAANEERFTRIKHDNDFPENAIEFCLDWLNITAQEIEAVAFYEKPIIKFARLINQHLTYFPKSRRVFVKNISSWFDKRLQMPKLLKKSIGFSGKIYYTKHHLSHAASAYYLSNFEKAAIVTLDGVGEWATTTIGQGQGAGITINQEIHFPHSLGLLYSTLTAYLGFKVNNDEYKVMGLAAYGDPQPFAKHFDQLITQYPDGSFSLNTKYFDFGWAEHMPSTELEKLFGFPTRTPESTVHPYHENIAASLQNKLETVVFNLLSQQVYRKYKISNLCLAGGVALNSVMNGKILAKTPFKKLFIPPDPGDAGGSTGAALYVYHQLKKTKHNKYVNFSPYLGPSYSTEKVRDTLESFSNTPPVILSGAKNLAQRKHVSRKNLSITYKYYPDITELLDLISDLIIHQKVIGWFQGRMEWGPRALGNRSILADARSEEMKDIINARVKHREMFRPFAPVILAPYVHEYFRADKNHLPISKYMLTVYPFKKGMGKKVPAVEHVDGTGRLQVIERDDNPLYYDLIETYRQKTGIPIIINTSFNIRGEPIVCTPRDAVRCFLKTDIDYLVIDHYLITKLHESIQFFPKRLTMSSLI